MRRPISSPALILALAAPTAYPLVAQDAGRDAAQTAADPVPLELARPIAAATTGETDAYTLELDENTFVTGAADQISVDVIVNIFNESGEQIARFDGPARGPEQFVFESKSTGTYRIDVAPFEDQTGEYEIKLHIAEPIATDPARRVDQLMTVYSDPDTPGGAIAVVEGGDVIFSKAYGAANLTHDIPFTTDTPNNIGSTSKQFTAYAIMLLAEQGKLSIDDDVRDYIPELPDFGQTVTLRHLLTHTSGYREFLNTVMLAGRRLDKGDYIDSSEIISIVQRQPELQNDPGAEWNYNNTAFALLAIVVERVGGEPFPQWMRRNVFEPLGMNDTFVRGNASTVIERSSQGYVRGEDGQWRHAADFWSSTGAGGIYSTVGDLAKWVRNYRTHELGSPHIFEQMSTPFVLTSGNPTNYGFGLVIDEFQGLDRIHHGGADAAHRSMVMYFPRFDGAVITQSNNAHFDGRIAISVAEAFFSDHFENAAAADSNEDESPAEPTDIAAADFDPASFDPESFDPFAGRYEMDELPGFIIRFWREDDKLYAQAINQPKSELIPISSDRFRFTGVDAGVTFNREPDGSVKTMTIHQNGDHSAKRLADEPYKPTPEQLAAYAGRYFSEELETFYHLHVDGEDLILTHRRFPKEVKLTPSNEHEFRAQMPPIAGVRFEVDGDGNVTALFVGNIRTRNVRFDRMD